MASNDPILWLAPLLPAVLSLVLFRYAWRQSRCLFDVFAILGTMLFMAFFVKPYYQMSTDGYLFTVYIDHVTETEFVRGTIWASLGLAALIAGMGFHDLINTARRRGRAPHAKATPTEHAVHRRRFLAVAGFGLLLTAYFTMRGYSELGWLGYNPQYIGVWNGVELATKIGLPCFFVYLYCRRTLDVTGILIALSAVLACLAATRRVDLFIFLIASLTIYHYRVRKIRTSWLLAFLALGLWGIWMADVARSFVKHRTTLQAHEVKHAGPVDHFMNGSALSPYDFVFSYAYLVESGREIPRPFEMHAVLATFWIPRQWWADKPVALGTRLARDHLDIRERSWSESIFGDSLMSGGIPLLLAQCFLLAYFLQKLRISFLAAQKNPDESRSSPYQFLLYALVVGHSISLYKNGMGEFILKLGMSYSTVALLFFCLVRSRPSRHGLPPNGAAHT